MVSVFFGIKDGSWQDIGYCNGGVSFVGGDAMLDWGLECACEEEGDAKRGVLALFVIGLSRNNEPYLVLIVIYFGFGLLALFLVILDSCGVELKPL